MPHTKHAYALAQFVFALGIACAPIAQAQTPVAVAALCKSSAACLAEAAQLSSASSSSSTSGLAAAQDWFYWFGRINMASTVANVERGIIPADLAGPIARGVAHSIDQGAKPGGKRPRDVLQTEKIITDFAGPEATLIHTGRSRQDMHPTLNIGQLRIELLDYSDRLLEFRQQLMKMAEEHAETFVPGYTNGVQAMPISYGQFLLAFADSFARDAERIRQAWPRLDRSPLGSAVMANSSWPLDRARLAELLGFTSVAENSYDSTQISPNDIGLEAVSIAQSSALRIGALMQDIHVQYHQTRPWLLLAPGRTYTSSAMPQKANPGIIQDTRALASDVVASTQTVVLRAHNVTPGMTDYKYSWNDERSRSLVLASRMMRDATDVMASLRVDKARALEELESDWTTSMELAETLQREHRIPFRVGHHFASEVVLYARAHDLKPKQFPYKEARRIYAEAGKQYAIADPALPLDEADFRRTLSPEAMVRSRVGVGGPQPAEVRRMLGEARKGLESDRAWVADRRLQIAVAEAKLNNAFTALLAR